MGITISLLNHRRPCHLMLFHVTTKIIFDYSPFHHFFPLFGQVNPRPKLPGVRIVCADGGLRSLERLLYVL